MTSLTDFIYAVLSHWILLGLAIVSFLLCQFVDLGDDNKSMPYLIVFGLVCILFAFYLTVSGQMTPPR